MIALVLQFVPVGGAIIAERYTYVPYIGLSYVIGQIYCYLKDNYKKITSLVNPILIIWSAVFIYLTFTRNFDWKAGDILFRDVIKKYPNMAFAYNNLGYFYQSHAKPISWDSALKYYNQSIQVDPSFHRAYSNRGVVYFNIAPMKDTMANKYYQMAIEDFLKALQIKSDNTDALLGIANTYSQIGQFEKAIPYYDKYIEIEKEHDKTEAIMWRGTAYNRTGKYDKAINDFMSILKKDPNNDEAYFRIGVVYFDMKKYNEAYEYLTKSITLKDNNNLQAQKYSYRGFTNYYLNKKPEAAEDLKHAVRLNPKDESSYLQLWITLNDLNQYEENLKYMTEAYKNTGKLDFLQKRFNLNLKLNRLNDAYNDLKEAQSKGVYIPPSEFAKTGRKG